MKIFEHIDKRVALVAGIFLIGLIGFFFYRVLGTPSAPPGVTELTDSAFNATLGAELLAALARLNSTKLDTSIFDDPVFNSLEDFGVDIAPQPIGRRNPFAPLSAGSGASASGSGGVSLPLRSGASGSSPPPTTENSGFDL
ncbi:MAG: hypothetical protein Q8Q13_00525 [bacterium]|nr:hypothetical protein [bacterium]